MRSLTITLGLAALAFIGFTSMQEKGNEFQAEQWETIKLDISSDSVSRQEVMHLIRVEIVDPLGKHAGLKSSWEFMDKTGHRNVQDVYTVSYEFRDQTTEFVFLTDSNEVFGDLLKMDGSLRSHVCSFKIIYPDKKVYARSSVLDKWVLAADYVKKMK